MVSSSALIWLPILTGLIICIWPKTANNKKLIFNFALLIAIIVFVISIIMLINFDYKSWRPQFVEFYKWVPYFNINYALGIDGFALPLILLTTFFTLLVIISSGLSIKKDLENYIGLFLILEGILNGVFAAQDAILFYIFFEAMLVPMFLIIGIWGGPNRIYATFKFFLYTFLGSVFFLIAILYLANKFNNLNFNIQDFQTLGAQLSLTEQKYLFWAFLLAFAIKIPMVPVHTWLPDAHVEAPTGGSVILAAILLKLGGFAMLRFILPIVPLGANYYSEFIIFLSLVAIVYIGLVALSQTDLKKLIAYSSVAHMGFVTLGLFISVKLALHIGITGAMVQMLGHGLVSGALFFGVGVLYDRLHTRNISDYGGVANIMPVFATLMMIFCLANIGLPGTIGFVGEFTVILAAFKAKPLWAGFAGLTLILGASYTLWMVKRVIWGEVTNAKLLEQPDLFLSEKIVLISLGFFILLFGLWPQPIYQIIQASSLHLVEQINASI